MSSELITSKAEFVKYLESRQPGVFNMKLRAILELGQSLGIAPSYSAQLPPIGMGSITLVDQVALVLISKLVQPKRCIEIGTFKGFSTRLLLDNTSDDCEICSIDLPNSETKLINATNEEMARASDEYNDNYLRKIQELEGQPHLRDISSSQAQRLRLIKADSTTLDFTTEFGNAEFIFIDGGHSTEIIRSDTKNALDIITKGAIVWHDFNSTLHTDVTDYIHEYCKEIQIFHILNSLVAFTFINWGEK